LEHSNPFTSDKHSGDTTTQLGIVIKRVPEGMVDVTKTPRLWTKDDVEDKGCDVISIDGWTIPLFIDAIVTNSGFIGLEPALACKLEYQNILNQNQNRGGVLENHFFLLPPSKTSYKPLKPPKIA